MGLPGTINLGKYSLAVLPFSTRTETPILAFGSFLFDPDDLADELEHLE